MAQLIYVVVVVVVARDLDAFEELLFIGFRVWGTTRFCCTCTCSAVFMEFRLDWIGFGFGFPLVSYTVYVPVV
jgi:hypothetical protein